MKPIANYMGGLEFCHAGDQATQNPYLDERVYEDLPPPDENIYYPQMTYSFLIELTSNEDIHMVQDVP